MIEELTPTHRDALQRFFDGLPDEDVTFVREDVRDPATIASWLEGTRRGRRWVALHDDTVTGFVAVLPLVGWSSHVGEIRLVVRPENRREGLGTSLARFAVEQAARLGLTKLTVEVVARQSATITMFDRLGFEAEALLRDHIKDRTGELQDVVLLAWLPEEAAVAMAVAGVTDEARTGPL